MLNFYEILKASKTGIAPDMWTALAGMNWDGADSGHEIKELTGIPPLSFGADGTPLLDFLINGNMSQNGTPTPTNLIQPQECGELETIGTKAGQYKIPIASANTTTPVYLGEVQSTRRIAKYEFTGNESYYAYNYSGTSGVQVTYILDSNKSRSQGYCNIYPVSTSAGTAHCVWLGSGGGDRTVYFVSILTDMGMSTIDEFKSYVQQQYANGTPITIWYILATETTGVVNEPLRKIGDYADTISMEQAGVSIPTLNGQTAVDIDTTLKPSEVYIKYKG